jgi:hypothetical protein
MSYSVLRRYTPPTCTLDVLAKQSPLSRWAGQTVLKNLRFQLSLDDPKLPKEEWVTVTGDRTQLEELCEAVQVYVQKFLQQSQTRLNSTFVATSAAKAKLGANATTEATTEAIAPVLPTEISLEPINLLTHQLNLGNLATSSTKAIVSLSTLQLFDLADALEEYATDVLALPNLPQQGWLKAVPNWGQVAAVAVLAVGLTASLLRMTDTSLQQASKETAPTSSQGASSQDQRIANQMPVGVVPKQTTSPISPVPTIPPPPPLGSTLPAPLPSPSPNPTASPTAKQKELTKEQRLAQAKQIPIDRNLSPLAGIDQLPAERGSKPQAAQGRAIAQAPKPETAPRQADSYPVAELPAPSLKAPTRKSANRTAADLQSSSQTASAFDVIPQVAEAREYFASRWKPPERLTQTLEYILQVDADGKVERIIPLSEASGLNVVYTDIPPAGETLVSPLKKGKSARIRLVLAPDGKVQTFFEALDQ